MLYYNCIISAVLRVNQKREKMVVHKSVSVLFCNF